MKLWPFVTRAWLPVSVFVGVATVHYIWVGVFPEEGECVASCVEEGSTVICAPSGSWFQRYIGSQSYWLGYSYSLPLAFAVAALRRYREQRLCAARNLALGSLTLSGFLAVAGCYLVGCCGSPMLAVYVSLLGAALLPFAKPLVAVLSTLSVLGAWWWMNRHRPSGVVRPPGGLPCADAHGLCD